MLMLAYYHFKSLFCGERVISLIFSELEENTGVHYLYPTSRYPIAHPVKQFTTISSKTCNKIEDSKKRKFTIFSYAMTYGQERRGRLNPADFLKRAVTANAPNRTTNALTQTTKGMNTSELCSKLQAKIRYFWHDFSKIM